MAKPYEDIGKDAVEFITRGFPNSGTFKISTETKTPNGVSLKANATRSFEYSKGAYTEKLASELEPRWEWKELLNLEFSGKLNVAGDFEGGVAASDLGTKGTKLALTGFQSDKDGAALKGQASFKNSQVTAKTGAKFPFKENTHVNCNGEFTFRHDNIHVGTDIRYDHAVNAHAEEGAAKAKDALENRMLLNFKAGYLTDQIQVVVSAEDQINRDKATSAKTPVYHFLNFNVLYALSSAVKAGFGLTLERTQAKGAEIHAGGEYKVDRDTVLKGKFGVVNADKEDDREFRISLAAKQNITERMNVTMGCDVNARAIPTGKGGFPGATKPHSFGFEIKFQ